MSGFSYKKFFWLILVFCVPAMSVDAQSKRKPLFQSIEIKRAQPEASPTPRVKPIVSSRARNLAARKTSFSALQNVAIPGYSGILVESADGSVVIDSYSTSTFNPASNVKVATTYAVLRTFGPNFRFKTGVWMDGYIDKSTRTLVGNVYVSGRDPVFNYEHAVSLANELNSLGVSKVEGDLVVTSNFAMNYSRSASRSAASLLKTIYLGTRSARAKRAWTAFRSNSEFGMRFRENPSVFFSGKSYVQVLPSNVKMLFTHESAPLREVVKATNSYSNNFLSERLGDMLGGAYRVTEIVRRDTGVAPFEFNLETCSGLGINRVSPRAQMRLLRRFKALLLRNKMDFSDVMPVAGLDEGTLRNRFKVGMQLGSVVGKTGTLRRTDRGVSTLSGEITTKRGKFFFVIFNQRGGVGRFRSFQNSFVPLVQSVLGGPASSNYVPVSMSKRLAKSRIRNVNGDRFRIE